MPPLPGGRVRLGRIVLLAFVTGFSGAIMPGPLLVAVIRQTPLQGIWAMVGLVTGHAILEFVLLVFLILGLRSVISRPAVRAAIGLVGGAALFYMSFDMLRHGWLMTLDLNAGGGGAYSFSKLMLLGAVICAANPYFTGWWATIGVGQLAQMAPRTTLEYLGFFIGHEAADYTWYGLVALLLITGRRWLTDGIYRSLILLCGAILMILSVWFLLTGIRLMRRAPQSSGESAARQPAA